MLRYKLLVALALFAHVVLAQNGYSIKLKIKGLRDTTAVLGYYYADKSYVVDTAHFDQSGTALFEGNKNLPGGIYMIILPQQRYFDLIMGTDQRFSLDTDTSDLAGKMKISGCDENAAFYDYQRGIKPFNERMKPLQDKKAARGKKMPADSLALLDTEINQIADEAKKYSLQIAQKNNGTFFAKLLTAMYNEARPDEPVYKYFDLADSSFLRTPMWYKTVRSHIARYIEKGVPAINAENDKFLAALRVNGEMYRYTAFYLLDFYSTFYKIGMNEVFVYLAENYFLNGRATWISSGQMRMIEGRTEALSASFVGKKAHDLKLQTLQGDSISLYDIKSKFIFLFFWKTGCGHCEDAAKKLREFYELNSDNNITILSVNTSDDHKAWEEFTTKHDIIWTNTWDKTGQSGYSLLYYVVSTPIMYILDQDKNIINKMAGDDSIVRFLDYIITNGLH